MSERKRIPPKGKRPEPGQSSARRKPCDGTANDYARHKWWHETPCPESVVAWRTAQRRYWASRIRRKITPLDSRQARKTIYGKGIKDGTLPGRPEDDMWHRAAPLPFVPQPERLMLEDD